MANTTMTRSRDLSCSRGQTFTVLVALIDGSPYGSAVQHTKAHVVPLQLAGEFDVVIDLQQEKQ